MCVITRGGGGRGGGRQAHVSSLDLHASNGRKIWRKVVFGVRIEHPAVLSAVVPPYSDGISNELHTALVTREE